MSTSLRKLPHAATLIELGIDRGLHLGAQVYVSLRGETVVDDAVRLSAAAEEKRTGEPLGAPLDADTLHLWMSACKPVAAVAAGQLLDRGMLDFDAPVADTIPEFAQGGKESITLRHVLTHTGGFRNVGIGAATLSWGDIIERICAAALEKDWVVGETAGYHLRTGWYILAEVIRRIDGRAYPEYVREAIFEPLGMTDSWIGMSKETFGAYGDRIGRTYNTQKGECNLQPYHAEPYNTICNPGGNGRGPMRELGRFYEMLLNGGEGNGVRILEADTVDLLTRPHRVGAFDKTFEHKMDWGLGFILDSNQYGMQTVPYGYGKHCSPSTFGHGGMDSIAGFADPDRELVVAIGFNGMPGGPKHSKRIRDVATAIYGDLGLT